MVLIGSRTLREAPARRPSYLGYIRLPPILVWLLAFFAGALLTLGSHDQLLTLASVAVLPVLAKLLWRTGEPPVALAALTVQWLQVGVGPLQATLNGMTLNELVGTSGASYATWLSLVGLVMLALGIRFANASRPPMDIGALYAELRSYSYGRVLGAYCAAQVASLLLQGWIWLYPGLTQALLAAGYMRWVFYFILAVTTLARRKGYGYLLSATAFEIVLGFNSFFADFKTVFFVFAVAYLMVRPRVSARTVISVAALSCVVFVLAAIWAEVKMDYRDYQDQGTGAQASMVGTFDKLDTLAQLVGRVDYQGFEDGVKKMANRVEYTQYFGYVTENVPRELPYDGGAIWWAAIYHVVTPRLLFPNKADLAPDIENTMRYTGLTFTGGGRDTEIPLGYMAESYIGFGPVGMFVPIFLLGLLFGYEYRYFATRRSYLVFAYGLTPAVFTTAMVYEETAIKILGGNLIVFIVAYLAWRFAAPPMQLWLMNRRARLPAVS